MIRLSPSCKEIRHIFFMERKRLLFFLEYDRKGNIITKTVEKDLVKLKLYTNLGFFPFFYKKNLEDPEYKEMRIFRKFREDMHPCYSKNYEETKVVYFIEEI